MKRKKDRKEAEVEEEAAKRKEKKQLVTSQKDQASFKLTSPVKICSYK